ncbi:hypothetical protein MUK42_34150 [Musa troglodytarum]|uniref:Uncharacterized protein n=1 Tax=Musa troglodytarum TaxID=320322 RepID=A0A9E7KAH5_9LILI|nr:hypothetical protein MUK42_34150 [Musa troglodytarum]
MYRNKGHREIQSFKEKTQIHTRKRLPKKWEEKSNFGRDEQERRRREQSFQLSGVEKRKGRSFQTKGVTGSEEQRITDGPRLQIFGNCRGDRAVGFPCPNGKMLKRRVFGGGNEAKERRDGEAVKESPFEMPHPMLAAWDSVSLLFKLPRTEKLLLHFLMSCASRRWEVIVDEWVNATAAIAGSEEAATSTTVLFQKKRERRGGKNRGNRKDSGLRRRALNMRSTEPCIVQVKSRKSGNEINQQEVAVLQRKPPIALRCKSKYSEEGSGQAKGKLQVGYQQAENVIQFDIDTMHAADDTSNGVARDSKAST